MATKLVEADPNLNVDPPEAEAKTCVQPGILWFLRKFNVRLRPMLGVFKYARFFCPFQVQELRPHAAAIEELRRLPFLDDEATIAGLQAELPACLATCDGCRDLSDSEKVEWWHGHAEQLPHWSTVVRKVLLLQVLLAAAERVFFSFFVQHSQTS